MPLAIAAPDKREVEPVWSYRWEQVKALGVPVRTATAATVKAIKAFAPHFVIVATGARPRPCPFDVSELDAAVRVVHAWEVLRDPAQIASATAVTIIGGGMVGVETADLLTLRGTRCTIIEALATVAGGMARNNRMELLDRLKARGTAILLGITVEKAHGTSLEVRAADGSTRSVAIGDCLVIATGPEPDCDVVPLLEEAGVEYAFAGDCHRPGDFLSCRRDAWMVALSVDHRFRNARTCGAYAPGRQ
jgi:pyruvate/2-oxoglutarate dehydrogenase complex dihydrolipoamide dehydrogenase (E3) component